MRLPPPRTRDPLRAPAIRWGVLGPGSIANAFTEAISSGTASTVVAVGSRSLARARAFANRHEISRAHGSYEDLVADGRVDAIYVATPHSAHHEHAMLALNAGKPVLVEKAFTRNAIEAREVFALASKRGLLAAEAMWSRYLPHYDVIKRAIEEGLLGQVVSVRAENGQRRWPDGPERLWRPELAGGSLLDLGVYPLSFADHLLGRAASVTASGLLTEGGVDAAAAVALTTTEGAGALVTSTLRASAPNTAVVVGTEARIELSGPFYCPCLIRLIGPAGRVIDEQDWRDPVKTAGLRFQAAEFATSLVDGWRETVSMPPDATMRVMEVMDEARRQIGISYPGESSDTRSGRH